MDKPVILSEETISAAFAGTNFGGAEKSDEGRRGLMVECLLKRVAGFSDGHTIRTICHDAGLLNAEGEPSREGLRWAFEQLYASGGPTIVERLNAQHTREQGKQDEQRFTMGEIAEWLPTVTHASALLKDKHYGIAAFTARNKESKP